MFVVTASMLEATSAPQTPCASTMGPYRKVVLLTDRRSGIRGQESAGSVWGSRLTPEQEVSAIVRKRRFWCCHQHVSNRL